MFQALRSSRVETAMVPGACYYFMYTVELNVVVSQQRTRKDVSEYKRCKLGLEIRVAYPQYLVYPKVLGVFAETFLGHLANLDATCQCHDDLCPIT